MVTNSEVVESVNTDILEPFFDIVFNDHFHIIFIQAIFHRSQVFSLGDCFLYQWLQQFNIFCENIIKHDNFLTDFTDMVLTALRAELNSIVAEVFEFCLVVLNNLLPPDQEFGLLPGNFHNLLYSLVNRSFHCEHEVLILVTYHDHR